MSRTKHRQSGKPFGWNPPPVPPDAELPLAPPPGVVSATECTGLERQPVLRRQEAERYTDLQSIHQQKPQGNIGKGNPNNDPSEIRFHRSAQQDS